LAFHGERGDLQIYLEEYSRELGNEASGRGVVSEKIARGEANKDFDLGGSVCEFAERGTNQETTRLVDTSIANAEQIDEA